MFATRSAETSGTEEETSIGDAAYGEAADRVRQPMDEPGGSLSFAHGARKVAPFSIAVLGFGISFGVLARPTMGSIAPIVMSATTFAGSAQFAAASIFDGGGTLVAAVVAAILLN